MYNSKDIGALYSYIRIRSCFDQKRGISYLSTKTIENLWYILPLVSVVEVFVNEKLKWPFVDVDNYCSHLVNNQPSGFWVITRGRFINLV